ncbi:MAG: hypothetical protein AAFV07_09525 [Bacteroidota bacterium]
MKFSFWLVGLLLIFHIGCQPETRIVPVSDNTAPPDLSVPEVLKENFINKSYISLLGRKPTEVEFSTGLSTLNLGQTNVDSRKAVLRSIVDQPEFGIRMFDVALLEILNGVDTAEIRQQIDIFYLLLTQPEYQPFREFIEIEIAELEALMGAQAELVQGNINRAELHRRCINNGVYDEINMGTQNFILATFEYFLGRYPTEAEEEAAIQMVDGFNTVLFGTSGTGKEGFLHVFFDSDDYFEGQVRDVYQDFLFRAPSSWEMSQATIAFKEQGDFAALLIDILSTDEYLGL